MKKFLGFLFSAMTVCSIYAAPVISWNAQNNFKGWHMPYRCSMKISDGTLKLDITGHDSSIRNNSVKIPTAKYDAIEIDYRAEGLPAVNNGEIAAIIINDEATLKRVYYYPESSKLMLISENSNYEPLVFSGNELDRIRIIGKAVAFKSEIR